MILRLIEIPIKKRLKTAAQNQPALVERNGIILIEKRTRYRQRGFPVAQDGRKIKPPSSPIRLFPRRCFPPSCDSRSRYRRAKRYFSRRTYLPKRRCEMNKAIYLFQRKIFSSRPLNTAREKKKNLSPLLSLDGPRRHSNYDEGCDASILRKGRKLDPTYTNRRPVRRRRSPCEMHSPKFDLPPA